jgi:hypothetical protein
MSVQHINVARASIALAALGLVAMQLVFVGAARAEFKTTPIKHVGYDDLKRKCGAAGGQFESVGKTDYWCIKDGANVVCDTKNCTGGSNTPKELRLHLQQLADPNAATGTLTTQ